MLVSKGAGLTLRDDQNRTAGFAAVSAGRLDSALILVEALAGEVDRLRLELEAAETEHEALMIAKVKLEQREIRREGLLHDLAARLGVSLDELEIEHEEKFRSQLVQETAKAKARPPGAAGQGSQGGGYARSPAGPAGTWDDIQRLEEQARAALPKQSPAFNHHHQQHPQASPSATTRSSRVLSGSSSEEVYHRQPPPDSASSAYPAERPGGADALWEDILNSGGSRPPQQHQQPHQQPHHQPYQSPQHHHPMPTSNPYPQSPNLFPNPPTHQSPAYPQGKYASEADALWDELR